MSTGRRRSGGNGRLNPCRSECECACHESSGTVTTEHPTGYCTGKTLTNTPVKLAEYAKRHAENLYKEKP